MIKYQINFNLHNLFQIKKIQWEKSYMSKVVNVETKLVPSSGRLSPMNTELTLQVPIMEILTFNSKESMSTTMKPPVEDTFPELFLWISNQEQWIQLELDLSVNFSDLTILFSVKPEQEITGPRDIIPKELNSLTQSSMLLEKKLKDVIAFKDSKLPILLEVELDQVWELSSFQRSEKNILTESWRHSQLSHPQKSQTPS